MKPSISVIVPFFHAEEFFEDAYQSIKKQTLPVNEIIIVIDGCGVEAENFLSKYHDIKVINLIRNGGPAIARNIGASKASSDLIAFLDADDKWATNKLEKQVEFLALYPEFSSCHTGVRTFKKEIVISEFNSKPFNLKVEDLLSGSHVVPTSLLIKKSAFEAVNGFDTKIRCSEDHDFTIRLVQNNLQIGFLAEPLSYLRRENHGNISSNARKILIGHFQLMKKHSALYNKNKGSRPLFIYKTFISCATKSSGLEKRIYYFAGMLCKKLFNVKIKKV